MGSYSCPWGNTSGHDRLIEIRRALDNLGAVTSELAAIRGRKEAQRILTDLLATGGSATAGALAGDNATLEPAL
jgi:hypothetical protein